MLHLDMEIFYIYKPYFITHSITPNMPSYSHKLPTLFIKFVLIRMYCTAHSQDSVGNDMVMRFSQWD